MREGGVTELRVGLIEVAVVGINVVRRLSNRKIIIGFGNKEVVGV